MPTPWTTRVLGFDTRAGDAWRRSAKRARIADAVAINTTDLGSMYMVAGASTVLAITGRRRDAAGVMAAGSLAWMGSQRIKRSFNRLRPFEADPPVARLIHPPTGSSFPSGHAAVAAAVGTYLGRRSVAGRGWPWSLMALWVALTRIQVGVHYPGDVTGGLILGWSLGRGVDALTSRSGATLDPMVVDALLPPPISDLTFRRLVDA